MNTLPVFLVAIFLLGMSYIVLLFTVEVYRRFKGRMVVRCPDSGRSAEVTLKALSAALISNYRKPPCASKAVRYGPRRRFVAKDA